MKYFKILIVLLVSNTLFAQSTINVDGFEIPTSIKVKDGKKKTKLTLNGVGFRSKMWIELYTQALYLEDKSTDAEAILDQTGTIATRLYITSSLVSKKKLVTAIEDGIKKSYDGNMAVIQERVNLLMSYFDAESSIISEGYVDFIYTQDDESLHIYINETNIGSVVGADFRKVFFGIWLSEKPVDTTLKRRLLGL